MTRRFPNYHVRQLAAALGTFTALTAFSAYATVQTDGPEAHAWLGPTAAGWLLTLFAAVWFAIVYTLAVIEAVRHVRRSWRTAPGTGRRRPSDPPLLPEPTTKPDWATERRDSNAAENWRASEPAVVPPVDPAAAVRPRDGAPVTDEDWAELAARASSAEAAEDAVHGRHARSVA